GMLRLIPNAWGNVKVGDYLYFELTRINNIEGGKFRSLSEFGPLMLVPVARADRHPSFGSGTDLHAMWKERVGRLPESRVQEMNKSGGPIVHRAGTFSP